MEGNAPSTKVKNRETPPQKAPPPLPIGAENINQALLLLLLLRQQLPVNCERQYMVNISTQPHSDALHKKPMGNGCH